MDKYITAEQASKLSSIKSDFPEIDVCLACIQLAVMGKKKFVFLYEAIEVDTVGFLQDLGYTVLVGPHSINNSITKIEW